MKFCGSTRASSKQRKIGRDGKGKGGRERETTRNRDGKRNREKEE